MSVPSFQSPAFPCQNCSRSPIYSPGPRPQLTLTFRDFPPVGSYVCVLGVRTKPEGVLPNLHHARGDKNISSLTPCSLPPPSAKHHLCLHGAGNHGDAALQHERGDGAHVHCPGAGLVQCYVLCSRIPDAWSLQHHDPEGQCFPQSFLWLQL